MFVAVFDNVVYRTREPADVRRNQKFEEIQSTIETSQSLLRCLSSLPSLEELRAEVKLRSSEQPSGPTGPQELSTNAREL